MAEDKSSSLARKIDAKNDQPCELSHRIIKQITKDYDEGLLLGTGAFGRVYKGIYEDGKEIAVKVLLNLTGINNKEFKKEFENLRRLKHPNVVQLVGFCNEAEEVLVENKGNIVVADKMHTALCFEYVCNGSLDKHIPEVGCLGLNWHMLYKIIKGICQGLEYLRHGLDDPVWHLDLKPANVLLGYNMIPKIADFGLSRLLGDGKTRVTMSAVGTGGYLPPEYIEHGVISDGFDIFSLGVIVAKLMAGREDYSKIDDMKEKLFVKHVHGNWRRKLGETLAPRQLEVYCEQVMICIQIAVKCMNRNRHERPTIQFIVNTLIETEKMIGDLGLQTEQFLDREHILPERDIHATTPEDGKADTASIGQKELQFKLLKKITNKFSAGKILGGSASGKLYKGILKDGEVITVKRFLREDFSRVHRGIFIRELKNFAALKHENIVELVGFCNEGTRKLEEPFTEKYFTADSVECFVCYEYFPNGSLQRNLFGKKYSSIDWETRFKIIKGICQGLLFLHSNGIIHTNLKPTNILLDNNMRPKIGDSVNSRLWGMEQGRRDTSVESLGYMDPHYLRIGEISKWTDIYSFGLLILEISTGEKNRSSTDKPSSRIYVTRVRANWTDEYIALKYPSLDEDCLHQMRACINIGLECVDLLPRRRPDIRQILDRLNRLPQRTSLGVQPRQINFPIGPKRLTSSSLHLTNSTDDRIAFRLTTSCKIPRRYLTKLPFCGILPPRSAYTLTVITREQKRQPASNSDDDFLTVQSSIARPEELNDVDPASVAVFLDTAGHDQVQEAKVVVACESLAKTIPNQIIDGQNYRDVLSVDVHETEPWILTSNKGGYVCIWNYQTQEEVDSIEVSGEPVYSAKFIERHQWFVVGSGGYIYVYNYITMEEEVDGIEAHDGHHIMSLAVNPSHSFVLSASDDHTIKLWDWANGWQCVRTFTGHDDTVTQVMFDPWNSESFASCSFDHTVKIWNVHSGTCNITWDGHPGGLLCVHYHRRYFQQFLVSGSSDGVANVWNLETDSCVDTLLEHAKGVAAVCWLPELRLLVTGSLDGTVRIWNWESTSDTYRLENIIAFNLGAINALGYLKDSSRLENLSESSIDSISPPRYHQEESTRLEDYTEISLDVGSPRHPEETSRNFGLDATSPPRYLEESTRIVVGCDQGVALMEINVL